MTGSITDVKMKSPERVRLFMFRSQPTQTRRRTWITRPPAPRGSCSPSPSSQERLRSTADWAMEHLGRGGNGQTAPICELGFAAEDYSGSLRCLESIYRCVAGPDMSRKSRTAMRRLVWRRVRRVPHEYALSRVIAGRCWLETVLREPCPS